MSTVSPKVRNFLVFFFFLPAPSYALGLVEKVQGTYQRMDNFRAEFVQKTKVEILNRAIEEKGEILFSRPGRFLIHYQGARERKYISDGKTLWIYHPREKELEVFKNVNKIVTPEALAFLGGLGEMQKEFQVRERNGSELVLIPKRRGSPFVRLVLGVDPQTNLVHEVTLFPKSGNKSHYRFSSIRLNQKVPASTFTPPPK